MSTNRFVLPSAAAKLFSRLPSYPGSLLFTAALNLALQRKLSPHVMQALNGKRICIRVRDAALEFRFVCGANGFSAGAGEDKSDLLIAANLHDFILLLRRQEDPDTLFFNRCLIMEGDTELGLLVKNTLDAIELPAFMRAPPFA